MRFPLKAGVTLPSMLVLWLVVMGIGFAILSRYEITAGQSSILQPQWPDGSRIPRDAGRATLVMFVHPHCPCSRASIAQLASIVTHFPGKVHAHVVVYKPTGTDDRWMKTDIWSDVSILPGVTITPDLDGNEAGRFHAVTSGQTMLYDRRGRLLFSGGVTSARGHIGESPGLSAISSLLTSETAGVKTSSVFGCSLLSNMEKKRDERF